jgi:hypothetical protein
LGSVNVGAASGHGSVTLSGSQDVLEFQAYVTTFGDLVNFAGFSPVRRVFGVGWVGFGQVSVSPSGVYVMWHKFIENEFEDYAPSFPIGNYPDFMLWDLSPGTVVNLTAYW